MDLASRIRKLPLPPGAHIISRRPPQRTATLANLPYDLLEEVFRHFDPLEGDRTSLHNCARVKREWKNVALSRLYRDILVSDGVDGLKLARSRWLVRYFTRSVTITGRRWLEAFEIILERCPGILALRVDGIQDCPFSLFGQANLASLRELSISSQFDLKSFTRPSTKLSFQPRKLSLSFGQLSEAAVRALSDWITTDEAINAPLESFELENYGGTVDFASFFLITSYLQSLTLPAWLIKAGPFFDLKILAEFFSLSTSLRHLSIVHNSFLSHDFDYGISTSIATILPLVQHPLQSLEFYFPTNRLQKSTNILFVIRHQIEASVALRDVQEVRLCSRTQKRFRTEGGWETFSKFCEGRKISIVAWDKPRWPVTTTENSFS